MTSSRRTFLRQTSLLLGGATFLGGSLFAQAVPKELTGIQLYSVRDDMRKDPLATLEALAKMGYRYVEHANYVDRKLYGFTATTFKKHLNNLGLQMPSGHTVMNSRHWDAVTKSFTDIWKQTVEDAALLGQEYVISPSMEEKQRRNYDDLMVLLEMFNKSGELCKSYGMKFGYHNHAFEFNEKLNGNTLYDSILKNTEPDLVIHQLDIGNMYNAGAQAVEIIQKYPGRFASMHVKDERPAEGGTSPKQYESTVLGTGVINVKEALNLGKKIGGTKHFIVEQEAYQGKAPLTAALENYSAMKSWGFI